MNQFLSYFNRNDAVNLNVFEISADYSRKSVPLASPEGEQEDDAGKMPAIYLKLID